jgi:hypothetical protein
LHVDTKCSWAMFTRSSRIGNMCSWMAFTPRRQDSSPVNCHQSELVQLLLYGTTGGTMNTTTVTFSVATLRRCVLHSNCQCKTSFKCMATTAGRSSCKATRPCPKLVPSVLVLYLSCLLSSLRSRFFQISAHIPSIETQFVDN